MFSELLGPTARAAGQAGRGIPAGKAPSPASSGVGSSGSSSGGEEDAGTQPAAGPRQGAGHSGAAGGSKAPGGGRRLLLQLWDGRCGPMQHLS